MLCCSTDGGDGRGGGGGGRGYVKQAASTLNTLVPALWQTVRL